MLVLRKRALAVMTRVSEGLNAVGARNVRSAESYHRALIDTAELFMTLLWQKETLTKLALLA